MGEIELGFTLSSEEHGPNALVDQAIRAEEAGFTFALISDHFHPWTREQGESPFVWAVLGGIARETEHLRVGTGVTCPMRVHPAIVAQAAATAAAMMPGRFFLGVGTGENLNEHVTGAEWPPITVRQEMLAEAIEVIRRLWTGDRVSHRGEHWTVEDARVFTRPEEPPELFVAAAGKGSAELAGRLGDGLISVAPKREIVQAFEEAGGTGRPRLGQLHVCYAESEGEARRTAHRLWPLAALGSVGSELRLPEDFEQLAPLVREEDVASAVVCGPDPERHVAAIREFADAGFTHIYVHQVGPDLEMFFRFYEREVLPRLGSHRVVGRPKESRRVPVG